MATDPRVGKLATDLAGTSGVHLYHNHALIKGPWANPTNFHIDNAYDPYDYRQAIMLWVALDDATVQNGWMYLLPGTHLESHFRFTGVLEREGVGGGKRNTPPNCLAYLGRLEGPLYDVFQNIKKNMRGHSKGIDLVVDTLAAEPGQRLEGHLHVGTMADGTLIRLPIVLINGSQPGATLYMQSISDGDELNGIAVIHALLQEIQPDSLSGRIIAVPIVNFHAFHARQAFSPIDDMKMNRCFPGKPFGTSSERIAHHLFETAISQSDYCIDLHQGGIHPMIDEVRVRVNGKHPRHKACLELARVFGIGYIFNQKGPQGQLAQAAPDIDIPTIDPELGGCMGWNADSIAKGVRGVQNILTYYGFVKGDPELPKRQVLVDRLITLLSNGGGFIYYKVDLYDYVEAHQPVAEICDVFGKLREVVRAPEHGIFWSHPAYPMVATGGTIGKIGIPIDYI